MVTFDQFLATGPALPQTAERLTRETKATLRLGERIFAMSTPEDGSARVKAGKGEQAELPAAAPRTYSAAFRVGRHGWVEVSLATVAAGELNDLLTEA
ncbi:MmcQ/YjbR family DNA-binding protein [Kitasatospora cystarginea]